MNKVQIFGTNYYSMHVKLLNNIRILYIHHREFCCVLRFNEFLVMMSINIYYKEWEQTYIKHMVNVIYFCGGCQENYHYLYILRFYLVIILTF